MQIDKKYRLEKAVSTDPTRVNLQNVFVSRRHAFTTNGHILAAVPVQTEKDDTPGWLTVDAFKLGRKVTPKDADHISISLNGQQILSDGTSMARPSGETFPSLFRILREVFSNRTLRVGINVAYLKDLADALGSKELVLEISKPDKSILVRSLDKSNHAVGVVIPIRVNNKKE